MNIAVIRLRLEWSLNFHVFKLATNARVLMGSPFDFEKCVWCSCKSNRVLPTDNEEICRSKYRLWKSARICFFQFSEFDV